MQQVVRCPFPVSKCSSFSNVEFVPRVLDTSNARLVCKTSHVWMTDCVFRDVQVSLGNLGSLDCFRCTFVASASDKLNVSALDITGPSSISLEECTFDGVGGQDGYPCILVNGGSPHVADSRARLGSAMDINVRLIGNVFTHLDCSPIADHYGERTVLNKHALLKNNRIIPRTHSGMLGAYLRPSYK